MVFAVLALAAEGAVRYRERHRAHVPGSFPFIVYQHRTLLYALVHNTDYFGWIHVDSAGFRRGLPHTPNSGAIRILADGASTTFDFGVSRDDRTWPARLEYWLHQLAPTTPVEVLNAGVPGYLVWQNTARLQNELYAHDPDVIILLTGHNDLGRALAGAPDPLAYRERPDEVRSIPAVRRWLSEHSLLFAKMQDRLGWIAHRSHERDIGQTAERAEDVLRGRVSQGQSAFERDIRFYLAAAKTVGIPVVLPGVVHVNRPTDSVATGAEATSWHNTSSAPTSVVLDGYRRYNAVLERVAPEYGDHYVDTAPFLISGTRYYVEGDPMHFNDEGADLMARKLAEQLIASGVLARRGRQ